MTTWKAAFTSTLFLLQGLSFTIIAQQYHKHLPGDRSNTVVCYYSTEISDRYIPAPEAYTLRLKSGQEAGASFIFTIENSPSSDADSACYKAGEIWGSLIYSPVPINVKVVFADQDEGTLASTMTPWPPYILDNNGYLPERIYIQALAEKFYGRNLNGNNPDMSMTYNKNIDWYYKLEGIPTDGSYDFLSTLLHEMAHGLGFYGYFYVDEDEKGGGLSIPSAFDGFLENDNNEQLADKNIFPQPSLELGTALTTPPVYFRSPIVNKELPDELFDPRLFVEPPWRPGNSLYHLDEVYDRRNGGRDALMTFSARSKEVVHDPGPITTYILYEIGWVHTFIDHDTLKDREDLTQPFSVVSLIYGDKGIKANSQYLFYSFNGFQSSDSLAMTPTGTADEFKADIPVTGNGGVQYYIKTLDFFDRIYTMPSQAPGNYYRFNVGTDNTPPTIEHLPIQFMLTSNDSVEVLAQIADNLGLDITQVEYKINDVDQAAFDLKPDTLADFKGYFIFTDGQLTANDIIKYRIKAVDGSKAKHTTYHPATGYHEFKVEDVPPYVDTYVNDFEGGLGEFLLDGFSHKKPNGFSSYGMHTAHPYPSMNQDNSKIELKAQLKVPIRLNPGDMFMSFDEIAYIESGEDGSKYGDEDFWDYVIVEGSKDGGNTWHNFILGWDCRYWKVWNDHFTGPLYQQQYLSTAVPDESAMRSHLVNLLAAPEFNDNDIILIRFRLYSDPYFAGWGWVIDNLNIGPLIVNDEYYILPNAIDLYPNPSSGLLTVKMQLIQDVDRLEISLYDMVGKEVFTEEFSSPGISFTQYFDLNELPNGLYLMKFKSGDQTLMKKLILAR